MTDPTQSIRHHAYEDVLAILLGTMVMGFGVTLYSSAILLTGSSAGLALLLQYTIGLSFGLVFFLINLPFYYLAVRRMGWRMALRTFIAVLMVSVFTRLAPLFVSFDHLDPVFAAILGGALMGMGLLVLFRHRTGLGGINILAMYLQERHGIRAGYFQLGFDAIIMGAALFILDLDKVLLSMLGAAVLNIIVAINHRPGRYVGIS